MIGPDEPSDLDRLVFELETARAGMERARRIYLRTAVLLGAISIWLAVEALWAIFR